MKTLIDCEKWTPKSDPSGNPENPGPTQPSGTADSNIKYIVIGVLVIAAIAILCGIVFVLCLNGTKKDGASMPSITRRKHKL
jgi:hypothetical protein